MEVRHECDKNSGTCKRKRDRPIPAPIRIINEFRELKEMTVDSDSFKEFGYTCEGSLNWSALILPESEPFNKKAWRVYFQLPRNYPVSPPKVKMGTKIFHPNVNDKGEITIELIEKSNWRSNVRMNDVVTAIIDLINHPNAENSKLIKNNDAAKLYKDNADEFKKKASDHANNNALKRPIVPPPRKKKGRRARESSR